MEFRLLGDLEVLDEGSLLPVGGRKQGALLAALLLQANRVVGVDTLIEELWGDEATPKATGNLHALVSRLRRMIGSDRIERHGGGYLLRAGADELDLGQFEQLREQAARTTGEDAALKLRAALELWRGPPLADFTYEAWAQNPIRRLEELRLVTLEERIDADLACARHAELVGELQALVAEHPLRETFRRQLMLALYRSGRQADALEAYRDARRTLDEELGLEPSPALRELEQAVLRQDPSLELPRRATRLTDEASVERRLGRRAWIGVAVATAVLAFGAAAGATLLLQADHGTTAAAAQEDATEKGPAAAQLSSVQPRSSLRRQPRTQPAKPKPVRRVERTASPARALLRPPAAPRVTRRSAPRTIVAPQRPRSTPTNKKPAPPPPPRPPPPPPPPPSAVRRADNFDDGVMDRTMWHDIITGTGVTMAERNGRLEVSIAADATAGGQYNVIDGHYGTQCRLLGDFDVRVDFEVLDWPATNGVTVQLVAWFQSGAMTAGRQSQNWDQGDGYTSYSPGWNAAYPSSDLRGSLRIRRHDLLMTTYYRTGGRWARLLIFNASPNVRGPTGAPIIGLQAMSTNEAFADRPVRVAFDNFVMTAQQAAC